MPPKHAFSLVELSIVLVILGLLAGGVLSGQSLIHAAELRAVSTEYARYTSAIFAFREKYMALPGDMPNATLFWGKDDTNCTGDTGTAATPGTCNGNGDSIMGTTNAANTNAEIFRGWQHLARAGLIEGTYTGQSGPTTPSEWGVPGVNTPKSRFPNTGWNLWYGGNYPGDDHSYKFDYGNMLRFGPGQVLTPTELWNIDKKMDDGKPATGKIMAGYWATCTNSKSNSDYAGDYALSTNTPECTFTVVNAF